MSAVIVAVAEPLYAVHFCRRLRRRLPRHLRRRLHYEVLSSLLCSLECSHSHIAAAVTRIYTHDRQDDWCNWLPMAEFAFNNSVNRFGFTPFRAVLGYDPQLVNINHNTEPSSLAAEAWLSKMEQVHREIFDLLRKDKAQRAQRDNVDKARKFQAGDQVLVDRRNLTIKEGTRKLSDKYIGPFTVKSEVGTYAYKLDLPKRIRMHNVIHVSLLKPYHGERNQVGWRLEKETEESTVFDVESILDSKRQRGGVVYRTRWLGFGEEEDTWEPWENLRGADDTEKLIKKFHQMQPNKPRDERVSRSK